MMLRNATLAAMAALITGCAGGLDLSHLDVRPAPGTGGYLPSRSGGAGAYEAAKRHLANGELGIAIDAFRQILRGEPTSVAALNGLAVAYDRIGRFDLSRRYYEQALGFDPAAPEVLNNLGYSMLLQGRGQEARALFERAGRSADPAVRAIAAANLSRITPTAAPVVQALRDEPPAPGPSAGGWIERTDAQQQTLVTQPRAEVVMIAAARHLDPRLISSGIAAERPAEIVLAPAVVAELSLVGPEVTAPPAANDTVVEVWNGAGRKFMASRFARYLRTHAIQVDRLANAPRFGWQRSEIRYAPADRPAAVEIAATLPFEVRLRETAGGSGVRLVLGHDALAFDEGLAGRRKRS